MTRRVGAPHDRLGQRVHLAAGLAQVPTFPWAVNNNRRRPDVLERMSREELSELYGVAGVTVDLWEAQGMPVEFQGAPGSRNGATPSPSRWSQSWEVTRRELAELLHVHVDTISRRLLEGLAAAVVHPGGRGEEQVFDLRLALRWWLAAEGHLGQVVRDDFAACSRVGVLALSQLSAGPVLRRLATPTDTPPDPTPRRPARRRRTTA